MPIHHYLRCVVLTCLCLVATHLHAQTPQQEKQIAKLGEALQKQRYEEVVKRCDALLAEDPKMTVALVMRGVAQQEMGNFAVSIADFSAALAIDADIPLALYGRAVGYRNVKRYRDAIKDLDKALALVEIEERMENDRIRSTGALVRRERVKTLYRLEAYDDALQQNELVLAMYPGSPADEVYQAKIYQALDSLPQALRFYERVLEYVPQDSEMLASRAIILARMERFDAGKAAFQQYIKLYPGDVIVTLEFAQSATNAGESALALPYVQRLAKRLPDNGGVSQMLGMVEMANGNRAAAKVAFNKSIALEPQVGETYMLRGILRFADGDSAAGFQDLDKAVKMIKDNSVALDTRCDAYSNSGRYAEARPDYEELLRRDSTNFKWLVNYAYTTGRLGDYPTAIRSLKKARELYPEEEGIAGFLGTLYHEIGDHDTALEWFAAELKARPDRHITIFERSKTYEFLGQYDKALTDCEAALKLDPGNAEYQAAIARIQAKQNGK